MLLNSQQVPAASYGTAPARAQIPICINHLARMFRAWLPLGCPPALLLALEVPGDEEDGSAPHGCPGSGLVPGRSLLRAKQPSGTSMVVTGAGLDRATATAGQTMPCRCHVKSSTGGRAELLT